VEYFSSSFILARLYAMSENAGIIIEGKTDDQMDQVKMVEVPSETKKRSAVIRNPANEITDSGRGVGDRYLYSPYTRGRDNAKLYEPIPMIGGAKRKEMVQKRNPLLPNTAYIPRTVVMQDHGALNVANPQMPTPYDPLLDVPDLTVANSLTENRSYRNQARTVNSFLDTRSQERRLARKIMTSVQPNRAQIVDIKAHRASNMPDMTKFMGEKNMVKSIRSALQG
jgi:hypothetical protein